MKKAIGFDSWTGGVQNFKRIARVLEANGYEFCVVHIGSWGGDPGHPDVARIKDVQYNDIRAYGGNRLERVLEVEQPDVVIFLSVDTFAHRAFNRLAQRQGIPTLHLYHGLFSVSVQDVGPTRQYKVSLLAQTRFVLTRIPKALRRIWPAYASALLKTGAKTSDWVRFACDILVMASGRRPDTAAPDARTTKCCVYVDADVPHATNRYGFALGEVVAVGNPDLYHFGLATVDIGSQLISHDHRVEVMYIDTGLIHTGFIFHTRAQFLRHLVYTREALARQGLSLVFKPHPQHELCGLLAEFAAAGIVLCARHDFMPRLRRCIAAIVEPTSLAIAPALMGMPLFLAQYGALAGQGYGPVLTSYPRHHMLTDCEQISKLLTRELPPVEIEATQQWIARNAGPLPADQMPLRVAAVLAEMIRGRVPARPVLSPGT